MEYNCREFAEIRSWFAVHELSVVKSLVDAVKQHSTDASQAVRVISIDVGSLTCVDCERLRFCFEMIRAQAGFDTAALQIKRIPARASCRDCGEQFFLGQLGESCPCGSYHYDMLCGNELNLTTIEFA